MGEGYLISERRACRVTRLNRGTFRYRSHKNPCTALQMRIREIARARVRYEYRKIRVLLNQEGWQVFAVAISWGWMNTNPASGIELPPRERRRESRELALGEIAHLCGAFEEPMRTIFMLGLLTGMRIGENLALRVEDVDLLGGILQVRRDVCRGHVQDGPKTKRSERRVPSAAFLIAAIQAWMGKRPAGSGWLFPSDARTPYHERNLLRREVWPVCDRLEVPSFGWHSCRLSFTTYGGNSGVPMPVLQSVLAIQARRPR